MNPNRILPFCICILLACFIGCSDSNNSTPEAPETPTEEVVPEPETVLGTLTMTGTNVNVRDQDWIWGSVVGSVTKGERFDFLEVGDAFRVGGKVDRWYRIRGDFGTGWVFGAFTSEAWAKGLDRSELFTSFCSNIPDQPFPFNNWKSQVDLFQPENEDVFEFLEPREIDPETFGMTSYSVEGKLIQPGVVGIVWTKDNTLGWETFFTSFTENGDTIMSEYLGYEVPDWGAAADSVVVEDNETIKVYRRVHGEGEDESELIQKGIDTYHFDSKGLLSQ